LIIEFVNMNICKYINRTLTALLSIMLPLGGLWGFSSCNKEPDESDLYTFTGQTIQEYVEEDDNLSLFRLILERANLWAEMRTYGQYTCYAPSNEGVIAYVDSLWNDPKSTDDNGNLVHNGMTDNSVEGLTDQQCKEIAKYHISTMTYLYADLSETSSAGANEDRVCP